MIKITYEEVAERLKEKGYIILTLKEEYKDTQQNICCEKEGLKCWCSVWDILSKKGSSKRFFSLSNPFFRENVETFIKNSGYKADIIDIKVVSKNKKKRILITLKCSCGKTFNRKWDDIKSCKYSVLCNDCIKIRRGRNHRKDLEEASAFFEENGYHILEDMDNFLRNVPVEVENQQGYRGFLSYNRLKRGSSFEVFSIKTNKKNYIYNLNVWAKNNGVQTKIVDFCDDKPFSRQGIKCVCGCGKEFVTSIYSFQSGKTRCDECVSRYSRYENIVENFLEQQSINYIAQYRVNSCRDILPLPFDFYLVDFGKFIEVDGEGHYKVCHFNQISYEDAKKSYESTIYHDQIKTEYCKQFNIPLLRIPYWEIQNQKYKEKIIQFAKE